MILMTLSSSTTTSTITPSIKQTNHHQQNRKPPSAGASRATIIGPHRLSQTCTWKVLGLLMALAIAFPTGPM